MAFIRLHLLNYKWRSLYIEYEAGESGPRFFDFDALNFCFAFFDEHRRNWITHQHHFPY